MISDFSGHSNPGTTGGNKWTSKEKQKRKQSDKAKEKIRIFDFNLFTHSWKGMLRQTFSSYSVM